VRLLAAVILRCSGCWQQRLYLAGRYVGGNLRPAEGDLVRLCELPHIGAAKSMRAPISPSSTRPEGMQMRAWMVGIAVAIGLIWSVAAMSKLVPVDGSEMSLAAISRPAE
jgi:hypothetical protein